MKNPLAASRNAKMPSNQRAFTLLEMMMVLLIIGMMAGIALPALKGIGQSNVLAAASRQLVDDLAYARMRAISGRTTVYVVFADSSVVGQLQGRLGQLTQAQKKLVTNLISGQYTAYALIAKRSVGDQPGRATPRYLTEWKRLPDGVFIPPVRKFQGGIPSVVTTGTVLPFARALINLPVPSTRSRVLGEALPYVAFDSQGRLTWESPIATGRPRPAVDEIIPLARGSIFNPKDAQGQPAFAAPDIVEVPPGNSTSTNAVYQVRIDQMTGRSRIEKLEVQ
jgi:prepilin-type N-terminal cleavage/methylation domain-containing protein